MTLRSLRLRWENWPATRNCVRSWVGEAGTGFINTHRKLARRGLPKQCYRGKQSCMTDRVSKIAVFLIVMSCCAAGADLFANRDCGALEVSPKVFPSFADCLSLGCHILAFRFRSDSWPLVCPGGGRVRRIRGLYEGPLPSLRSVSSARLLLCCGSFHFCDGLLTSGIGRPKGAQHFSFVSLRRRGRPPCRRRPGNAVPSWLAAGL